MGLKHPLWLQGGGRIRCGGWKHVVQRRDDDMRTLMAAVAPGRRAWGMLLSRQEHKDLSHN